jgi:hypothetical protein
MEAESSVMKSGGRIKWGEAGKTAGYTLLPNPTTNLAGYKKEEDISCQGQASFLSHQLH